MAAKASATTNTNTNAALMRLLMQPQQPTMTLGEYVADTLTDATNSVAEVASRSWGGASTVWDAGLTAGKIDGAGYASRMLQRVAARNGLTLDEAAALLAPAPAPAQP